MTVETIELPRVSVERTLLTVWTTDDPTDTVPELAIVPNGTIPGEGDFKSCAWIADSWQLTPDPYGAVATFGRAFARSSSIGTTGSGADHAIPPDSLHIAIVRWTLDAPEKPARPVAYILLS